MHVLIVKTSSLGDILHCFPVIDYFRTYWEPLTIDWVVESRCRTLLERHPGIDHVIPFDSTNLRKKCYTLKAWKELHRFHRCLRRNTYDVVFDFQGNSKSALVTLFAKSRHKVGFGTNTVPEWPNLWVTNHQYDPPEEGTIREDYLYLVQTFFQDDRAPPKMPTQLRLTTEEQLYTKSQSLKEHNTEPVFLICPWSHWPNKTLSEKTLVKWLHLLHEKYRASFWILWGTEEEKKRAFHLQHMFPRVSQLLQRMSLPLLQAFFSKADALITMDSLPLHLAAAANIPTFSVFGPSSASKYAPEGELHFSYQGQCPYGKQFHKRCPILRTCKTGLCMKGIDSSQLFEKFSSWYESAQSIHPPPKTLSPS